MRCTFLDIDGVVATMRALKQAEKSFYGSSNLSAAAAHKANFNMKYWPFDSQAIKNLHTYQRSFWNTDIKHQWVISSSWRMMQKEDSLKSLLALKGLQLIGNLSTTVGNDKKRGDQIQEWLDKNQPEQYCVIDDDYFYDIVPIIPKSNCVITTFERGFDAKSLKRALGIIHG